MSSAALLLLIAFATAVGIVHAWFLRVPMLLTGAFWLLGVAFGVFLAKANWP